MYKGNLSTDISIDLDFLTVEISRIEHDLGEWQHSLVPALKLTPWVMAAPVAESTSDLVFEKLSVIIRLRFLHAKLLLHRATIRTLGQRLATSQASQNDYSKSYFGCLAQQSLVLCMRSAVEIVDIVCTMSKIPSKLGSWWFSTYYSKYHITCVSQALNIRTAFHAVLVLVKCLIYHFGFFSCDMALPCPIWSNDEVAKAAESLIKGKEAIERVGQGTRSSKRICRTLLKMIKICASIGKYELLTFSGKTAPNDAKAYYSSSVDVSPVQSLFHYLESTGHGQDSRAVELSNMDSRILNFEQSERLETEFSDFWMQSDLDIFADFGGVEVGLSGLIAS